jgi:multiple sugar transport system permease protein
MATFATVPQRLYIYTLLGLAALATIAPFYWEFVLATRTTSEIASTPPPLWIGTALVQNYQRLVEYAPQFWRSMLNSGVIAVGSTTVTIFFSALGGYAFARYQFPFKEQLFWLLLLTMLIPGQLGRIDGCGEFGVFWRIVLPLAAPAAGALAITSFIGGWNSFLGPLTLMSDPSMYTYPVALANLKGVHGTDIGALLVGSSIATVPMLLITVFGSRRIIDGLTSGALSGQ